MKSVLFAILLLLLSAGSIVAKTTPLCVIDPEQMPPSWRPSAKVQKTLNPAPWSASEAKDAEYSIRTGLDEMISYFERKPSAIKKVGADSIEALLQVTYASANKPELDLRARNAARRRPRLHLSPFCAARRSGRYFCALPGHTRRPC